MAKFEKDGKQKNIKVKEEKWGREHLSVFLIVSLKGLLKIGLKYYTKMIFDKRL